MEENLATDEQIIASLEAKISDLNSRIQKYKEAIGALKGTVIKEPTSPELPGTPMQGTFKETVIAILRDLNKPLTGKEIYNFYKLIVNKDVAYNTFSGQFSQVVNNTKSVIKKYTFPNNPLETKYYYLLNNWFVDEHTEQEYLNKVIKK